MVKTKAGPRSVDVVDQNGNVLETIKRVPTGSKGSQSVKYKGESYFLQKNGSKRPTIRTGLQTF